MYMDGTRYHTLSSMVHVGAFDRYICAADLCFFLQPNTPKHGSGYREDGGGLLYDTWYIPGTVPGSIPALLCSVTPERLHHGRDMTACTCPHHTIQHTQIIPSNSSTKQEHTLIASGTDTALTHECCLEILEVLGDHDLSAGIALLELLLIPHSNRQHSKSQSEAEQSEGIAACKRLPVGFHDGLHPLQWKKSKGGCAPVFCYRGA